MSGSPGLVAALAGPLCGWSYQDLRWTQPQSSMRGGGGRPRGRSQGGLRTARWATGVLRWPEVCAAGSLGALEVVGAHVLKQTDFSWLRAQARACQLAGGRGVVAHKGRQPTKVVAGLFGGHRSRWHAQAASTLKERWWGV